MMTSTKRRALPRGPIDPFEQLPDPQSIRTDPVDRRDRPVEDVVAAPELAGPFDGQDVERLLDHAQPECRRGQGPDRSGSGARR